jgi:dipeptidyl-peptidase 4
MMTSFLRRALPRCAFPLPVLLVLLSSPALAQDRLRTMPGYDRFQQVGLQIPGSVVSGAINAIWDEDGRAFRYQRDTRPAVRVGLLAGQQPARVLPRPQPLDLSAPTAAASAASRRKAAKRSARSTAQASWVYGEELGQNTAMWWSPDGRRLAYYGFDESRSRLLPAAGPDEAAEHGSTSRRTRRPASPTPSSTSTCTTSTTGRTTKHRRARRQPFTNDVVGHYVYRVGWTPDGSEITLNRTNRRQNVMEFTACRSRRRAVPRDRARGVAAELDDQLAADPYWRTAALPLDLGADRLPQHLPVRPQRPAARHADDAPLRGRRHRARR